MRSKERLRQNMSIWHAQMILYILRLKKSKSAWISRTVMIDTRQQATHIPVTTQHRIKVYSTDSKQGPILVLNTKNRLRKSLAWIERRQADEFKRVAVVLSQGYVSFKISSSLLQASILLCTFAKQSSNQPRIATLCFLSNKLGMRVVKAIFCVELVQLAMICALEYLSLTPLYKVLACLKNTSAYAVILDRSVKLLSLTCLSKLMVRFCIIFAFSMYLYIPSHPYWGTPFRNAFFRPSSLHYVILALLIIEGSRQAEKDVNKRSATAMRVKKAESGEEYPFSLSFQKRSLSVNFMLPILISRTNSTSETKINSTVMATKKVLFLPIILFTYSSEPVRRYCSNACYSSSLLKLKKVLSWIR